MQHRSAPRRARAVAAGAHLGRADRDTGGVPPPRGPPPRDKLRENRDRDPPDRPLRPYRSVRRVCGADRRGVLRRSAGRESARVGREDRHLPRCRGGWRDPRTGPAGLSSMPRPLLVGILNITDDSFSDGGRYLDPAAAIAQARRLVAGGADIVELGAAASNIAAKAVTAEEEIRRLNPVIAV